MVILTSVGEIWSFLEELGLVLKKWLLQGFALEYSDDKCIEDEH